MTLSIAQLPVTQAQLELTADWIVAQQEPSGALPWHVGGHLDPWDHVQAAMGLSAAGRLVEAERAYDWSRRHQRADGAWAAKYRDGIVEEDHLDTNFTAYLATGVWHHWRVTGDRSFLDRMWPTVDAAIGAVVDLQRADGTIEWSPGQGIALLAGNASIHLSLRCAVALAGVAGQARPQWVAAAERLGVAVRDESLFVDKPHSMDWYYPLLGAPVPPDAGERRLKQGWDTFVVDGWGIRCVTPNLWVTGAETCELVLALDAYGRTDDALAQLAAMQHLRDEDGSYWTGLVVADQVRWPVEQTTWTAATVILASDALTRGTGGNGLFRGEGLA